jgi:hypothetical protein
MSCLSKTVLLLKAALAQIPLFDAIHNGVSAFEYRRANRYLIFKERWFVGWVSSATT